MKLIACLGNPGKQYELTRHNAGFVVGRFLLDGYSGPSSRYQSEVYQRGIGDDKMIVLFPQTFMNLSGKAVRSAMSFYKIMATDICVVYDDFDIGLGELRFRSKGSAGTHNGMKSIVLELGTTEFSRLRVGIGPKSGMGSVSDFVLSPFLSSEYRQIEGLGKPVLDVITLWASGDIDAATRRAAGESPPGL